MGTDIIAKILRAAIILAMLGTFGYAQQENPVRAPECGDPPRINGVGDDSCWTQATWQPIDQLWIPWGDKDLAPEDFSGRFKVTWSSDTDELYFLVEVVDDVLVDGYRYPADGYYNWDVIEIFIDEDNSRGDHKLNQNAFAYHITAGHPESVFEAMDLAAGWEIVEYSDHLACQIEHRHGRYPWEIALHVYDASYDPSKPASANRRIELEAGKRSGLSLAYCDNDSPQENPKTRDHFIGSVAVDESRFNDHRHNADDFGTLELVPERSTAVESVPWAAIKTEPVTTRRQNSHH